MLRRSPQSTRPSALFPYTALFLSYLHRSVPRPIPAIHPGRLSLGGGIPCFPCPPRQSPCPCSVLRRRWPDPHPPAPPRVLAFGPLARLRSAPPSPPFRSAWRLTPCHPYSCAYYSISSPFLYFFCL